MSIKDAPCKGCERRSENCHAKCEDYKVWKDGHEKYKKQKKIYDDQARCFNWSESSEKAFTEKLKKIKKKY